jgi:hypothetical protein
MLGIWRFFRDGEAGWKWQRLSINKVVMAESRATFAEYDECVQDAIQKGYQHQPSQEKIRPRFGAASYNRPYVAPAADVLPAAAMQEVLEKRAG